MGGRTGICWNYLTVQEVPSWLTHNTAPLAAGEYSERTLELRSHDRLRKGPCAGPQFCMKAFKTQTHKVKENDIDVKGKFKAKEK